MRIELTCAFDFAPASAHLSNLRLSDVEAPINISVGNSQRVI